MDFIYGIKLRYRKELPNKKIKGCEWLPNDFPGKESYFLMYSRNKEICQKLIENLKLCATSNGYSKDSFELFVAEITEQAFGNKLRWGDFKYELDVFYPIIENEAIAQIPLSEMDQYLAGNWKDIDFWAEGDFCDHGSDSCSCPSSPEELCG